MKRRLVFVPLICAVMASGCALRNPDVSRTLASVSRLAVEAPEDSFRGPLTTDAAVQRASAASDEIAALLADVQVAASRKDAVFDLRDPELRLSYGVQNGDTLRKQTDSQFATSVGGGLAGPATGTSSTDITDESDGYALGFRFFPRHPWQTSRRVSAETARIYAAVAELLAAQWRLSIEVRTLFAQTHYLEKDLAVMADLAALYRDTLDLVKDRMDQGQSTVQDLMTASRRYLGALSDNDETLRDYQRVRRELASLVAAEADLMELVVNEQTFPAADLTTLRPATLVSYAMERRADLSALFWNARAARDAFEELHAARIPWPRFIQASYAVDSGTSERSTTGNDVGRPYTRFAEDDDNADQWQIGAAFDLPVFSRFNAEGDVLEAEWRGAQARERKARARVKREIGDALAAAHGLADNRARYQAETAPIIDSMTSTLEGIEDVKGVDPADVARVREQILESRRMEIQSELEYQLAVISLEAVLGMPLSSVPVNQAREPRPAEMPPAQP